MVRSSDSLRGRFAAYQCCKCQEFPASPTQSLLARISTASRAAVKAIFMPDCALLAALGLLGEDG